MRIVLLALFLAVPAHACDVLIEDGARGRTIPVRITLPGGRGPVPVVFYTPGLGGMLAQGSVWAGAWARAGVATVQFQHPGSDVTVYREAIAAAAAQPDPVKARAVRAARIRAGTSAEQIDARLADLAHVHAVLAAGGRVGRCNTARLDTSRLGIAGHSMGAWVAQLVAGQRLPGLAVPPLPVRGALAISGSPLVSPAPALADSARPVRMPMMLVTGSLDGVSEKASPEAQARALAERTALWPALPPGDKSLFVAAGATHMQLAGTPRETPAALARSVGALTAGFWSSTFGLAPPPPPPLAPGDRYDRK
ncbi:alpha/beta hydrolase family protein [Polymorphobacter sp.]|uniref:alpha/beta hydrolase family protein n=1 Tax=Polymorphobacter sp. TaxID=1909290 RepID=UPI003F70ADCA